MNTITIYLLWLPKNTSAQNGQSLTTV